MLESTATSTTQGSSDNTLARIEVSRKLAEIAASIESFLIGQSEKLQRALNECARAVDENQKLQTMLREFEERKLQWEQERQSELKRLNLASEKLTKGWQQLEQQQLLLDQRVANAETITSELFEE